MRTITELLSLIELAKASQFRDVEIRHLAASISNEEMELLWQHELENDALPRLNRANQALAKAQAAGDLRGIERARGKIEFAQAHIERCLRYGARLMEQTGE